MERTCTITEATVVDVYRHLAGIAELSQEEIEQVKHRFYELVNA